MKREVEVGAWAHTLPFVERGFLSPRPHHDAHEVLLGRLRDPLGLGCHLAGRVRGRGAAPARGDGSFSHAPFSTSPSLDPHYLIISSFHSSYAAALAAIALLALAHEALAAHRAALAKACACGPGCGGSGGGEEGKGRAPLRRPASSPALPAPVPAAEPCCCGPSASAATGTAGALAAPLLGGDEEAPARRRDGGGAGPPPGRGARAYDTAAYALHAATSYLLMLAVMTFNLGACAAVMGGLAVGHAVWAGRGGSATLGDACCAPAAAALEADAAAAAAAEGKA